MSSSVLPDDLTLLLEQMSISPSTPSSGESSPLFTPVDKEYMTTSQRIRKLNEMRTSLQQQLILSLVRRQHVGEADHGARQDVENQVEEYRDFLDGVDLLISGLRRKSEDTSR